MSFKTKFIDVVFPNGEKWRIKAYPIAVERAYSAMAGIPENNPDYNTTLNDEINYALCPEGFDDLLLYLESNMEWDKIDKELVKIPQVKPMYSEWLLSGEYVPNAVISND